jgi:uncharacterized coiled-coil protein SlyX
MRQANLETAKSRVIYISNLARRLEQAETEVEHKAMVIGQLADQVAELQLRLAKYEPPPRD